MTSTTDTYVEPGSFHPNLGSGNIFFNSESKETYAHLFGIENSTVVLLIVSSVSRWIESSQLPTGWVKSWEEDYPTGTLEDYRFTVLLGSSESFDENLSIPVSGTGFLTSVGGIIRNSTSVGHSVSSSSVDPMQVFSTGLVDFPEANLTVQHRRIHMFGVWQTGYTAPAVDASYYNNNQVLCRSSITSYSSGIDTIYFGAYTSTDPTDVSGSAGDQNHVMQVEQESCAGAFAVTLSVPFSSPTPPLCNDPSHVPVTITITARGPVDVQVDPAE